MCRVLGHLKIAAIGPGSAEELARYGLRGHRARRVSGRSPGRGPAAKSGRRRRFLLARASRGRELLAEELTAHGGRVEQIVVYASRDVPTADPEIARLMREGKIDWVSVTSSAIARSVVRLFGPALAKCKLATISPLTTATLRELGHEAAIEARQYTIRGLIDALVAAERGRSSDA